MKKILLTFMSLFSFFGALYSVNTPQNNNVLANPVEWFLCSTEMGAMTYKMGTTELLPYLTSSKSFIGTTENGLFNSILELSGYKFGQDDTKSLNAFERFGLRGLTFTSYGGEWLYYNVDPCNTSKAGESTDYGEFYDGRLNPQSTYSQTQNTRDVRSLQVKGIVNNYWFAFQDTLSNVIFGLGKLLMTITLSLVSLSFSEVGAIFGINETFANTIFTRLYQNFYQPFVVLMIAFTGLYIAWKGIVKREFRTALTEGVVIPISTFFLSIILANNLSLLMIPGQITQWGQSVILSALSSGIDKDNNICNTEFPKVSPTDNTFFEETGNYMKNVMGCRLWSEFLFKPWTQAQWGSPYEDLNRLENINSKWVKEPSVKMGNRNINNWALFNISVMSGLHEPIDGKHSPTINGVDKDWYRIVDALANYDEDVIVFHGPGSRNPGSNQQFEGSHSFFEEVGPFAKTVADEAGLYASVMLAQAALESGYGKYPSGTHNYFGIKCGQSSDCTTKGTSEEYNGQIVNITAAFQNYSSFEDGFRGYARFIWGEGAAVDFSVGTKARANSPEAAIEAIHKKGYATNSDYTEKIINIINTYNLKQYDTPNVEPTKPDDYKKFAKTSTSSSDSSTASSSSNEQILVYEQKNVPPLKQWNTWVGANNSQRIGTAFMATTFIIVGSIPILIFSLILSSLSIILTLLMMMFPIFLLFALLAGKGTRIFKKYLQNILKTIVSKFVFSFLLIVSIIVSTNAMKLVNEVGYLVALVVTIVMTIILVKNKDKIVNQITANFNAFSFTGFNKAINGIKNIFKFTGGVTTATAIGSIVSKNSGGKISDGAKIASSEYISNILHRTESGRRANVVKNIIKNKHAEKVSLICSNCGKILNVGDIVFFDPIGLPWCEDCALMESEHIEFEESIVQNQRVRKFDQNLTVDNEGNFIQGDSVDVSYNYRQFKARTQDKGLDGFSHDLAVVEIQKQLYNLKANIDSLNFYHTLDKDAYDNVFDKVNIPETIREFVSTKEITEAIALGNNDKYFNLIKDGWRDWYKYNNVRPDLSKSIFKDLSIEDKEKHLETVLNSVKIKNFDEILNDVYVAKENIKKQKS